MSELHPTRLDGHVAIVQDERDRPSRLVTMAASGRHVWQDLARPKIRAYYDQVLQDFSVNDTVRTLHYLLKILDNMKRIDNGGADANADDEEA